jgi:hypothetical protein
VAMEHKSICRNVLSVSLSLFSVTESILPQSVVVDRVACLLNQFVSSYCKLPIYYSVYIFVVYVLRYGNFPFDKKVYKVSTI